MIVPSPADWAKKIKEAQTAAEEEIKTFKTAEERKFQEEFAQKYENASSNDDLEAKTKTDVEEVKTQYKKNRDAAVALMIAAVVKVDLSLSDAEKRQVMQRFAPKQQQ